MITTAENFETLKLSLPARVWLRIKISEGQQYHYFDVGDVNFRQTSPLLNVYVGLQ